MAVLGVIILVFLAACSGQSDDSGAGDASGDDATSAETTEESAASDESSPGGDSASPQTEAPDKTATGTEIIADSSDFGTILFDAAGQAIYIFDIEGTSAPRCYDACEEAWPPVLTDGDPVAGDGTTSSLLGTTRRTDGTTQVTYADQPLYFYAHEEPREVKCHDVFLNGGKWYAVQPNGERAA